MTAITKDQHIKSLTSSVAMTVVMVSLSMLFLTLLLGFAVFRLTSPVWPPMGMNRVDLFFPIVSTLIIAISSLTFENFKSSTKFSYLWLTIFLGVAFMISQFLLWNSMKLEGLYVSKGIFPSLLYSFTWIHFAHILVGVGLLAYLMYGLRKVKFLDTELVTKNIGMFWHFLGIVWFIMFITMFVF